MYKKTSELKRGDVVKIDCGHFKLQEDTRPAGKPDKYGQCYIASSICIYGHVPGYFKPGSTWKIQGNDNREFFVIN